MAHEPNDVAVLNVIQAAAADVVLSGGKLQLNDGSNDLLSEALKIASGTSYTKDAYTLGVARDTDIDFASVALLADSQYRVAVVFPKRIGFNNTQVIETGGLQEANQRIAIREYIVSTGTSAPTADELKDLFVARINLDAGKIVTASSGGAGVLTIIQDNVEDGAFLVEAPAGAVETEQAAYLAPAGTPAIVEALAPAASSPTAEYTTYTINFGKLRRHNAVSGGEVAFPEFLQIFADETALNFAAFAAGLDAVLDGTHTPVADYFGI